MDNKLELLRKLSVIFVDWGMQRDDKESSAMAGARSGYLVAGQEIYRILEFGVSHIVEDEGQDTNGR